jgi:hypothetical protein
VMIFRAAARVADLALRRAGIAFQDAARASERRLLAVALGVPWLTLVAVAEPDKPERFWWLWGLQVLFLAAFVTEVLPRLGARRAVVWAAAGVVIGLVAANGQVLDRAAAWRDHGWAGADAPEIRVIDYVADELRADGKARAAIGYRLFVYRFMPAYHIRNAEYKVGSDFDLLLQYRGGISNADSCAEGFSAADEYRIVRTVPRPEEWAPRLYFHVPLGREFELVRDIYPYRIYKRTQRDLARRVDRDSIGWGHVRSSA